MARPKMQKQPKMTQSLEAPLLVAPEVVAPARTELEDPSSGQQTAKRAIGILLDAKRGFVLPTPVQRKALVVAFAQANYILYGKAFDIIKVSGQLDLESPDDIGKHLDRVTVYEIKSTSKEGIDADFRRYFFSLSTAELLVAQSLGERYRFAFVNTRTRTHAELSLREVMARARGIYPTWSIQF